MLARNLHGSERSRDLSLLNGESSCQASFDFRTFLVRYNDEETALALYRTSFEVEQRRIRRRRRTVRLRQVDADESGDGAVARDGRTASASASKPVAGPLNFVGMAFQNSSLLPWRTILQNVMLPLEIVEPHASRLRRERACL